MEDPIHAAFRLLPAAILVLVAGLGPEDREVLAYLVTLPSVQEAAGGGRGSRRRRRGHAWSVGHPPTHGCGCFECYISFWSRWDRSPERDRILDAVQAFEEHLDSSAAPLPSSKRRDRGRRRSRLPATPPPPPMPQVVEVVKEPPCAPPTPLQAPASKEEEDNVAPELPARAEEEECSADEERKGVWAAVWGGVLATLRLWGIRSPSAT